MRVMRGADFWLAPVCVSLFTLVWRSCGKGRGVLDGNGPGGGPAGTCCACCSSRDVRGGDALGVDTSPSRGTARPRARKAGELCESGLTADDADDATDDCGRMDKNSVASSSSLWCSDFAAGRDVVCGGAFLAGAV